MATIGIDVDGTLYSPWEEANKEAFRLLGREAYDLPWDEYDTLRKTFGNDVADHAFMEAVSPDRIHEREIFPGCKEAIRELQIQGFKIIFISHNHNPDGIVEPLTKWLRQNFGSQVRVCVLDHRESKLDVLKATRGIMMIDDKPSILMDTLKEGLIPLMPLHPYNKSMLEYGIPYFDPHLGEWELVPKMCNVLVRKRARATP